MQKLEFKKSIHSDYLQIVPNIQYFQEYMQFALWFATPKQYRKPKTQKEFANEIGICQDTLTDWKQRPEFYPLVLQLLSKWMKDRIPNVVGGLYKKTIGKKASASDVGLFLRLASGEFNKPKQK